MFKYMWNIINKTSKAYFMPGVSVGTKDSGRHKLTIATRPVATPLHRTANTTTEHITIYNIHFPTINPTPKIK